MVIITPRIPANKGQKLPPEPLTSDELRTILRACRPCPTGLRNRAAIVLMWRAQLRVSEALALKPSDLDASQSTVRVLHGKGDKSRVVGLDPQAWEVVARWLEVRDTLPGLTPETPLLCTLRGGPVSASYMRNLMRRLHDRTGIAKRLHNHGLRHTGAFELANEGTPIHVIQAILGHSSLATTDPYLRHLAPQQVIAAGRARRW